MIFRHRFFRAVRKLHIIIGLVSALYFMLKETDVRMDIAVGDLHSGLIFGKYGAPAMDFVAAVWFVSILSGLTMLALRRSIHSGAKRARKQYIASPAPSAERAVSARAEDADRVTALR
jgi:hypothetical protein